MTPERAARFAQLHRELAEAYDEEARELAGGDSPANVLSIVPPKPLPRRAPPRPLGPVSPEAAARAKDNLRRRGFLVTEGGGSRR